MNQCRILLVDDHQIVLDGLRALFATRRAHIVGEARDGERAVEMATALQPDFVVMDISMPHMNGVEAAREISRCCPNTRTVIYTMHSDQRFLLTMFLAGVAGIVLKEDDPHELLRAMDVIAEGGIAYGRSVPPEMVQLLLRTPADMTSKESLKSLSPREMDVFRLLADGITVKHIADRLGISHKTVETHKYNIFKKLGTDSLAVVVKLGIRHGIIAG